MSARVALGLALAVAVAALPGCALLLGTGQVDRGLDERVAEAGAFGDYPLYWLGEEFEGHRLVRVGLPAGSSVTTVLVYGTCTPDGPIGSTSCNPPLQLQLQPLCAFIGAVAADRAWERRSLRGAPLGTVDGAPVLFTDHVQVKVYAGEGVRRGASYRALQQLRSLNGVEPVLGPDDPIPGADRDVLAGRAPCPP